MVIPSDIRVSADGRTACVGFLGGPLTLWQFDPVNAARMMNDGPVNIEFDPAGDVSLQQAIDDAPDGARLLVATGDIRLPDGGLIIEGRQGLTLVGRRKVRLQLYGPPDPALPALIHIRNSRAIRLVNLELDTTRSWAVKINGSSAVQLLDCDARGGLDVVSASGVHIERCVVHNLWDPAAAAFRLGAGCEDVRLLGNRVFDNDHNRAGDIRPDQLLAAHNWSGEGNKIVPHDLTVPD